jgi:hypothetical protein
VRTVKKHLISSPHLRLVLRGLTSGQSLAEGKRAPFAALARARLVDLDVNMIMLDLLSFIPARQLGQHLGGL